MLGVFLTVVVPGLGHLYYGYNKKAFALIGVFLLGGMFPLLYVVLYPYALYDIWRICKENSPPKFNKAEASTVIIVGLIVPILTILLWISIAPPSSYLL